MKTSELQEILGIKEGESFEEISASDFEETICERLSRFGKIERQVFVENRYDGRRGRIDVVLTYQGKKIPIEIDRKTPRKKSKFKVSQMNKHCGFVITRSEFKIWRIPHE